MAVELVAWVGEAGARAWLGHCFRVGGGAVGPNTAPDLFTGC